MAGVLRISFSIWPDIGFFCFCFTVNALSSESVSAFWRLRLCRFFVFGFALGVGSLCGRGGFVFVFSRTNASYIARFF